MDAYNVPKKVNRHVLKAINILSGGDLYEAISVPSISSQVKYQMRNLVPVADIDRAIQASLKNMSEFGVIEKQGRCFCLGKNYSTEPPAKTPPAQPNAQPDRKLFRVHKKSKSNRNLNPNSKRRCHSEESLSGDEFERTRKRMRSNNKKLESSGNQVDLPKARQANWESSFHSTLITDDGSSEIIPCRSSDSDLYDLKTSISLSSMEISPVPSREIIRKVSAVINVSDVIAKTSEVESNSHSKDSTLSVQNGAEVEQSSKTYEVASNSHSKDSILSVRNEAEVQQSSKASEVGRNSHSKDSTLSVQNGAEMEQSSKTYEVASNSHSKDSILSVRNEAEVQQSSKASEVGSNSHSKDSTLSVHNGAEVQPSFIQTSATDADDNTGSENDVKPFSLNENTTLKTENMGFDPNTF